MRSRRTVSAVLGLQPVAHQQTIKPLAARFSYSREDPYAVRIVFGAGRSKPVEWTFARDLLSMGIERREGLGDVTVWPSAGSESGAPCSVLNIEISSPSGQAHFEASVREISDFLRDTYQLVPAGEESGHVDVEAELTDLLRRALLTQNVATLRARARWSGRCAVACCWSWVRRRVWQGHRRNCVASSAQAT
jgi:hypothetical protein